MKISRLKIENYRSIESLDLSFPTFYAALCGKNDSGKTSVVRAIRGLMKEESPFNFGDEEDVSIKEDFPKWKQSLAGSRRITISLTFNIHREADAGLYQFMSTYLSLQDTPECFDFTITASYGADNPKQDISLQIGDNMYDRLKSQEVLKKMQSSRVIFFYNSTEFVPSRFIYRDGTGTLKSLSGEDPGILDNMKKTVNRSLKKLAKRQQAEITDLVSRLEGNYRVGLSLPPLEIGYMPVNITLGDKKIDVNLDNWGSGTRNRTLILMTLFRAHKVSLSTTSASKITPIIVIEEPESFLHPSAQAQFSRVLQGLSEEFKVQVLSTTHSPYMLSQERPESNILLDRQISRNQLRETIRINTSGDNWMKPFGLALGVDNKEFLPWKDLFFRGGDSILLVEGDTDKEYFELMRSPEHGTNRLGFAGEIYPYGGCGNIQNQVLLKFIRNRYKKAFVTFDLDVESEIEKTLIALGLQRGKDFLGIGVNGPGKKNIEGLLPESVTTAIYGSNPSLVQQALNGTSEERKQAKLELKRLLLNEFKRKATPTDDYYRKFYSLSKAINKAISQ